MTSEVIAETVQRFTDDPAAARSQPTVTAKLAEGRASMSAGGFEWQTDLPPGLGGANAAPSPTAYLLSALAGCAVVFIHDTLAPQLGVPIENVEAVVRCSADAAGLVGIEGADPRLGDITVGITLESSAPDDDVERLRRAGQERCSILLAITEPNDVEVNWL